MVDAVSCNNDDVGARTPCSSASAGVSGCRTRSASSVSNDLDVVSVSVPSITSVRTHRYEMGAQAVRMIAAAIGGGDGRTPR